jgi:hypothetical protein
MTTITNGPHDHDHLEPPAAIHHGLTISAIRDELERVKAERDLYLNALVRLRDCDWAVTLPDRMDGVRKIAREAIQAGAKIGDGSPHHALAVPDAGEQKGDKQ